MNLEHPLDELARLRDELAEVERERDRLRVLLREWQYASWTPVAEGWEADFADRVAAALAPKDTYPEDEDEEETP